MGKMLTTHDLPATGPTADRKVIVITTSDFDLKGQLKDAARKRIEGTKMITTRDLKEGTK